MSYSNARRFSGYLQRLSNNEVPTDLWLIEGHHIEAEDCLTSALWLNKVCEDNDDYDQDDMFDYWLRLLQTLLSGYEDGKGVWIK